MPAGTIVASGSLVSPGGQQGIPAPSAMEDVGSIKAWPSVTPPPSWMLADGSAVSRTLYPVLFGLVGTSFGAGDGSTTFNLPDVRSRFILGTGAGIGLTNRALAATGGEENHQLVIAELASHTHVQNAHNHTQIQVYTSGNQTATGGGSVAVNASSGSTGSTTATNQNTGSDTPHNTMPPFLVVTYIIKVSPSGGTTAQAPIADQTQNGLLRQVSGNTTDFVDGTNHCQPLAPVIWSARLRSLNILGNPTMEIDQMNCGTTRAFSGTSNRTVDRWFFEIGGTHTYSCQQQAGSVAVPGTSFYITQNFLRATLTTQQASLGASNYADIYQQIEGPAFREILGDVFSVSLLVRSSVANLQFGFSLQNSVNNRVLGKLCTLGAANTWTLIQLPNLPSPASSGGSWPVNPGANTGWLYINLAPGTSTQVPANDTWQTTTASQWAANGTYNFSANPVNTSTFDVAYVQLEPGNQSTTLIDLDWQTNYDRCLRYYSKSYDYDVLPGTATFNGDISGWQNTTTVIGASVQFRKPMAKVPTVVIYNGATGAASSARMAGNNYGVTGVVDLGKGGFDGVTTATMPAVTLGASGFFHYVADTGW